MNHSCRQSPPPANAVSAADKSYDKYQNPTWQVVTCKQTKHPDDKKLKLKFVKQVQVCTGVAQL